MYTEYVKDEVALISSSVCDISIKYAKRLERDEALGIDTSGTIEFLKYLQGLELRVNALKNYLK